MRSGLLAVGVILLVLGAILYFVPSASATQENSVSTTTYATLGDSNSADNSTNSTNETNSTTSMSGTTTTTTTNVYSDTVNTADTNGGVIYVYVDKNGDMYSERGTFLGAGISSSDMTTTVGDRYGSQNTAQTTTVSDNSYQNTANTNTVADTSAGYADKQNTADAYAGQTTNNADTNGNVVGTSGTATTTKTGVFGHDDSDDLDNNDTNSSSLFANRQNVNDAGGAFGGSWLRTLAILSMVLGAILTILGLVLPSNDYVDARARTTHPSGRRVRYEREEEREVRR